MKDDDNPILKKSFAYALRIIKLYRYLVETHKEYTLSKEILVSGTHIGKHATEATDAESRERFRLEMGAALRKASENEYWLRLVHFAGYITEVEFDSMNADRLELFKILTKITKTSRGNG